MNIYDALKKDHEKVKMLLQDLVTFQGEEDYPSSEMIDQIRDELIPHARAEEAVFYNSLRSIESAKDEVRHAYREHLEAETLLRTLQLRDKVDLEWRGTAKKLLNALNQHIAEEENKIFPLAQRLFTDQEAVMMEEAFQKLKSEVKNQGMVQTSLEYITNLMPERFVPAFRSVSLNARL